MLEAGCRLEFLIAVEHGHDLVLLTEENETQFGMALERFRRTRDHDRRPVISAHRVNRDCYQTIRSRFSPAFGSWPGLPATGAQTIAILPEVSTPYFPVCFVSQLIAERRQPGKRIVAGILAAVAVR